MVNTYDVDEIFEKEGNERTSVLTSGGTSTAKPSTSQMTPLRK